MDVQITDGSVIRLEDAPFARGGEGNVHRLVTQRPGPKLVAKLYTKPGVAHEQKVAYLVKNPPADLADAAGHSYLAWPHSLIYQAGSFVGFLMPEASGKPLEILCQPKVDQDLAGAWIRFDHSQPSAKNLRFTVCVNLCHAVAALHQKRNYAIADLKPTNIIVSEQGLVSIIDLDSVQVTDGRQLRFAAPVRTDEYAPPEAALAGQVKQHSWDSFSLGIILYRLFTGIHPFQCQPRDGSLNGMTEFIRAGLYPHGSKRGAIADPIPPPHQRLAEYPPQLADLFIRCFDKGLLAPQLRPTANEWFGILHTLLSAPPDLARFSPSSDKVLAGDEVELTWQVSRPEKLTLVSGKSPELALAPDSTSFTHKPTETTRYVLRAESAFGQVATAVAEIQVFPRPVVIDFTPGHRKIKPGQATTLHWKAKHVQRLTLYVGARTHDVTGRNSFDIKPTASADYQLEALALDGRTTISTVTAIEVVQPVQIKKFSANRTVILPTLGVQFSWKVVQGEQLTLEPDGLDVTGKSGCVVHPGRSTTYRLVARNDLFSVTSDPVHIEVHPLPRLDAFNMPPAPRLTLTPPPTLGPWMPHDPAQARRQLFAEQVLPPAPAGSSMMLIGNIYARLRTALTAKAARFLSGLQNPEF
jgi:serine/threonine protein kinase